MKKIISLIAAMAITLSASVSVFAATVPADADLTATVTITDDNYQNPTTGLERFVLRLDLSGLGTLGDTTAISYLKFEVHGDVSKVGSVPTSSFANTWNYGNASTFTGIDVAFTTGNVAYVYRGTSTCNGALQFKLWGTPGDTVTINTIIGYSALEYDPGEDEFILVEGDLRADVSDSQVVTLPGGTQTLELDVTGAGAAGAAQFAHGYIWTASITEGEGEITSFDVAFTDSALNVLNKSINNIDTLNSWIGLGTKTFQIGLKTARTLSGATFSIADNAEGSDTAVWSAE